MEMSTVHYILVVLCALNIKCLLADPDLKVIAYDDLSSTAATFSDPGVSYFSQLLFDVTREQLVVGARDTIYRLTIDSLQELQKAIWSAPPDKIEACLGKGQSEEDCRNYIKVLLPYGTKLFTCGTNAFSPLCSWRELENISKVTNWTSGLAMCSYNPHANITSLMSEKGVYFAGTPVDFSGADSAIVKDFGGHFIRTVQFNSKWLNEPQFVGSFETDSFVYFLFRESAVEYMNCGKKIYSRIARVCKEDNGGDRVIMKENWTTFLKARLNCSLPGEYPFYFDEIQGITYLPDDGLVYATFNTPRNSIPGSAVCSFNLTQINAAFEGPYKHQESIGSAWEKRTATNQNQKQCRNFDPKNLIDSSKYQLMDNAVQPVVQVPLYYSQLETIVHIAVDVIPTKLHREMHIMYVSTEENIIKKISVLSQTMKTCVLEVWKPLAHPSDKILSIHFLKEKDSLYVASKNGIIRIPSQHCHRHKNKQACMDAMDPYCGWNELREQCSPPPEKNPSITYWHQSVTGCPTFTHPGGWSEWSTWSLCSQVSSNTDGGDQCMCSSRQCNNPPPKNGGAYCEGVSIQVTNCTVHGDWTNWSEWSACSQSCGFAVKTRKRTCSNPAPAFGGRVCVGQDTQESVCIGNPPCPEPSAPDRDGRWGAWSSWSECTVKCGRGFRVRTRKCDNPPPQKPGGLDCQGCHLDYEICNDFPCQDIKRLSSWTPWQNTSNGVERRYRFYCKAPVSDPLTIKILLAKEEERICQSDGQCYRTGKTDPDEAWSEWSEWSPCSAECGEGTQFRTRKCEIRNEDCIGSAVMRKTCNTQPCKSEWGCWSEWSSCSVTCGRGIRKRSRICLFSSNRSMKSDNCEGSATSQESCEMPPCESKGWLPWSNWSDCDEFNQQFRTRKCSESNPEKAMCQGAEKEIKSCNEMSNDISDSLGIQFGQVREPQSAAAVIGFCFLAFVIGLCLSAGFCYYWTKKHRHSMPSSPHYISKQNPYVTVPLKEVSTPKRTPSFSKNSITSNGAPKLFAKPPADYETATIKRNSHSLLNGHARTSTLEQDKFF